MEEEQKGIVDAVFDELLSNLSRKPPKDYKPSKQERGEPLHKYMLRLDAYNAVYWDQRNWELYTGDVNLRKKLKT